MIKNKGAINCSDANLNSHKDEIQARVTAGTISMTGGLLPTTSHFFLQNTMKNIAPSTTARLPGTGEMHDFRQQGSNMKKHRSATNRLSSQNEIIDINLLSPSSNKCSNIVNIDSDSGISDNSILEVGNTKIIHSSPKMKRGIRKRTVFRLASSFASASPNTQEITSDVLTELTTDNSRSSIVVDSFEGVGDSQEAAGAAISILKISNLSKNN